MAAQTSLIGPLTSGTPSTTITLYDLALTLFITLKGWGTGVLHLGGSRQLLTHFQAFDTITTKARGLVYYT